MQEFRQPPGNTIGANASLPIHARLDSRVETLMAMGFNEKEVIGALSRAKEDFDLALSILVTTTSSGSSLEGGEFDTMQSVGLQITANPVPQTEITSNPTSGTRVPIDHFLAGLTQDAPFSAVMDSRVQSIIEMGFDGKAAEEALKASGNDVNRALELLMSTSLNQASN